MFLRAQSFHIYKILLMLCNYMYSGRKWKKVNFLQSNKNKDSKMLIIFVCLLV